MFAFFGKIRDWFAVRRENAKLRTQLVENAVFISHLRESIFDQQLRFEDMVLPVIHYLMGQPNNEIIIDSSFSNSENLTSLRVRYEFLPEGIQYWLESVEEESEF